MTNRDIIKTKPRTVQIALKACMTKKMMEAPKPPVEDDAYFEAHAKSALEWWEGVVSGIKLLMRDAGADLDTPINEEGIAKNLIAGLMKQPVWSRILVDLEAL